MLFDTCCALLVPGRFQDFLCCNPTEVNQVRYSHTCFPVFFHARLCSLCVQAVLRASNASSSAHASSSYAVPAHVHTGSSCWLATVPLSTLFPGPDASAAVLPFSRPGAPPFADVWNVALTRRVAVAVQAHVRLGFQQSSLSALSQHVLYLQACVDSVQSREALPDGADAARLSVVLTTGSLMQQLRAARACGDWEQVETVPSCMHAVCRLHVHVCGVHCSACRC